MKKLITCLLFFSSLTLFSCKYSWWQAFNHGDDVDERINSSSSSITEIEAPTVSNTSNFSFIAISDVHFGRGNQEVEDFINEIKKISPAPDFCICLGDIVEHGIKSEFSDYNDFVEKIKSVVTSEKVYTVIGNHDLFNDGWDYFERMIYPYTSLFHFTIGNYSFYFTDSASGSLGPKQLKTIKSAMRADSTRNKIFCTHYPVYGSADSFDSYYSLQNPEETALLLTLLEDTNTRLYLSGHIHNYHKNKLSRNLTEYVTDGYLDKYKFLLVTINGDDNSVKNISF